MIIAIDIDEVLADGMPEVIKFFNEKYNQGLSYNDLHNYAYLGFLGETKEEAKVKLFEFFNSPYLDMIKPMKGAVEAINQLSKKHELRVVTSRPFAAKEVTLKWLNYYFINKFNDVHFNNRSSEKDFLPGQGKHKAEICNELGIDILIEDLLKYANHCDKKVKVFLLDKPWNQGETASNVIRVKSWKEIVFEINKLS